MARETERIVVGEDGFSVPVIEVLTGRGVIFGKSGSGKSNTAGVMVEELLEKGFPLLIVDIEGEYFPLRDRYEVITVGDGDRFEYPLFETDPERIVDFCLDQNRPVILDVSDVLEIDRAHDLIEKVLRQLFSREKRVQQPFLVLVEEIHEFLPQQGGLDDLGETLIRIAKRGRKRGLGLCGMSQRPAAVDKDFITQCDWIVWHRLTWENDTRVVKSILGGDTAREVQELETGEAIVMTDWDESIRRVQFRRKRTADAGDTPSLSPAERRDLTADAEPAGGGPPSEGPDQHGDERPGDTGGQDAGSTEDAVDEQHPSSGLLVEPFEGSSQEDTETERSDSHPVSRSPRRPSTDASESQVHAPLDNEEGGDSETTDPVVT
ncbi:MAG: helicase HerA domain-containing protein, partial [Halodesulfurarchaeum sp.]